MSVGHVPAEIKTSLSFLNRAHALARLAEPATISRSLKHRNLPNSQTVLVLGSPCGG
jgi:hypothetical protein